MARDKGDRDVRHLLQVVEHLLDDVDTISGLATHLLNAVREGKPISPTALQTYDNGLQSWSQRRDHLRTVVAHWWTLLEEGH